MDEKKYVIISDFNLKSNNRGTAALGYGAISFLLQNNYIEEGDEIINYNFYRNPFHRFPKEEVKEFEIEGRIWRQHTLYISAFEKLLYRRKIHFRSYDLRNNQHVFNNLHDKINAGKNDKDLPERNSRVEGINDPKEKSDRHARHLQIRHHVQDADKEAQGNPHRESDDAENDSIKNADDKRDKALAAEIGFHQKIRLAQKIRFVVGF